MDIILIRAQKKKKKIHEKGTDLLLLQTAMIDRSMSVEGLVLSLAGDSQGAISPRFLITIYHSS